MAENTGLPPIEGVDSEKQKDAGKAAEERRNRADLAKAFKDAVSPISKAVKDSGEKVSGHVKGFTDTLSTAVFGTIAQEFGILAEIGQKSLDLVKDTTMGILKTVNPLAKSLFGSFKSITGGEGEKKEDVKEKESGEQTKILGELRDEQSEMTMLLKEFVTWIKDDGSDQTEDLIAAVEGIEVKGEVVPDKKPDKKEFSPGLLLKALLAVAGFAAGFTSEFIALLGKTFKLLKSPFSAAMKWFKKTKLGTLITERLGGLMKSFLKPFDAATKWFKGSKLGTFAKWVKNSTAIKFLKDIGSKLKGAVTWFGKLFKPILTIVKSALKNPVFKAFMRIGSKFMKYIAWPIGVIMTIVDGIKGFMSADKIFGDGASLVQKIAGALGGVIEGLTFGLLDGSKAAKFIDNARVVLIDFVGSVLGNVWEGLKGYGKLLWGVITFDGDMIKEGAGQIKGAISGIWKKLGEALTWVLDTAINIKNFVYDLVDQYMFAPIRAAFRWFKLAVADAIDSAIDYIPFTDGVSDMTAGMRADVAAAEKKEKMMIQVKTLTRKSEGMDERQLESYLKANAVAMEKFLTKLDQSGIERPPIFMQQVTNAPAVYAAGIPPKNPGLSQHGTGRKGSD